MRYEEHLCMTKNAWTQTNFLPKQEHRMDNDFFLPKSSTVRVALYWDFRGHPQPFLNFTSVIVF